VNAQLQGLGKASVLSILVNEQISSSPSCPCDYLKRAWQALCQSGTFSKVGGHPHIAALSNPDEVNAISIVVQSIGDRLLLLDDDEVFGEQRSLSLRELSRAVAELRWLLYRLLWQDPECIRVPLRDRPLLVLELIHSAL